MNNNFDHYVFDLDQTIADSAALKHEQDAAARDFSKRQAFYSKLVKIRAFPGIHRLICDIQKSGGRISILTNAWKDYATKVALHLSLEPDEIIHSAGKPHKNALLKMKKQGPAGYRIIHVGDSPGKDLRESVSAGVPFILCRWGELEGGIHTPSVDERPFLIAQVSNTTELRPLLVTDD